MEKATRVITKMSARKRPPVTGTLIGVRMQPDRLGELDGWSKSQDDAPSRPEAMRRLVELGLSFAQLTKPLSAQAAKASDMAAEQIDKLADTSTPEPERHARKRRLLKGPEEFREMRGDQPKTKKQ
jgi:hypothetical protein